jgi:hypothetical protein
MQFPSGLRTIFASEAALRFGAQPGRGMRAQINPKLLIHEARPVPIDDSPQGPDTNVVPQADGEYYVY